MALLAWAACSHFTQGCPHPTNFRQVCQASQASHHPVRMSSSFAPYFIFMYLPFNQLLQKLSAPWFGHSFCFWTLQVCLAAAHTMHCWIYEVDAKCWQNSVSSKPAGKGYWRNVTTAPAVVLLQPKDLTIVLEFIRGLKNWNQPVHILIMSFQQHPSTPPFLI